MDLFEEAEEMADSLDNEGKYSTFYRNLALLPTEPEQAIRELVKDFEGREGISGLKEAEKVYYHFLKEQQVALEADPYLQEDPDFIADLKANTGSLFDSIDFEDYLPGLEPVNSNTSIFGDLLRDFSGLKPAPDSALTPIKPKPVLGDGLPMIEVPDSKDSGEECLPASPVIGYAKHTDGTIHLYVKAGDELDIYELQPTDKVLLQFYPSQGERVVTVAELIKDRSLAIDATLLAVIDVLSGQNSEAPYQLRESVTISTAKGQSR